jgi:thioredoxin reductase
MIVRKGEMRASKAMQHRVKSKENIDVKISLGRLMKF